MIGYRASSLFYSVFTMLESSKKTFYIIGIGGIGMSGIAILLHGLGHKVLGSDPCKKNESILKLESLGIKVFPKHEHKNITDDIQAVCVSSAVPSDNVEIVQATNLGIRILSRAEIVHEILRSKRVIAISGSHGKTTATSMTADMLSNTDLDPSILNGGILNSKQSNAYLGSGEWVVFEADESDGTFIHFGSEISVITNIDREHMEYFKDQQGLEDKFLQFIHQTAEYSLVCWDNNLIRKIACNISNHKLIKFGVDQDDLDIKAVNIREQNLTTIFDVVINDVRLPINEINNVQSPMFGKHNVCNALATIAIGLLMNIDTEIIKQSVANFQGVKRRFSTLGVHNNIRVIDDYAHHPTEIKESVKIANKIKQTGRSIIVLQPHRYTRVRDFMSDFVDSIMEADYIYISEVYGAGEHPIENVTSDQIWKGLQLKNKTHSILFDSERDNLTQMLLKEAKSNDVVLFMGAGNVTDWAHEFYEQLKLV